MHRLLWMYIALHDLGAFVLGASHGDFADQPAAWHAAVGVLAADAPPILAVGGSEADTAKLDAGACSSLQPEPLNYPLFAIDSPFSLELSLGGRFARF